MKTNKLCLLLAASTFAITTARSQVNESPGRSSPSSSHTRVLNEASSDTGTIMRKEIRWSSKIPLNRTYAELSPEQKTVLHSMYESLAPGDEPPFPLDGLKPIFSAVKTAQAKLLARGELKIAVTVGPDGIAKEVADFGSTSDPEMTRFAASVLLMTKFKPAVCAGAPCTMQFPFNLSLKGS